MASFYYGCNRGTSLGEVEKDITTGTSSGSTDIEIRIDETKSLNRNDVVTFLRIAAERWASPAKNVITTYPDL